MNVTLQGTFLVEAVNLDGSIAWQETIKNSPVTVGLNDLLAVTFGAGTQKTAWYLSLIDNTGYTGLAAADTMASHGGWTESTSYDEATRPQWTPGTPSGGVVVNATVVTFTINGSVTLKGLFCASNSTKAGTTGILWATALFAANQTLGAAQTLRITYTITATGS